MPDDLADFSAELERQHLRTIGAIHATAQRRTLGCPCVYCHHGLDPDPPMPKPYVKPEPTTMPGDLEPMYRSKPRRVKLPRARIHDASDRRFWTMLAIMVSLFVGYVAGLLYARVFWSSW